MERHRSLENRRERDIILIAIWSRDMSGVYDAESVAIALGYSDTGSKLIGNGWYETIETNILSMEESQRMNIVFLQSLRVMDRIVTWSLNVSEGGFESVCI